MINGELIIDNSADGEAPICVGRGEGHETVLPLLLQPVRW